MGLWNVRDGVGCGGVELYRIAGLVGGWLLLWLPSLVNWEALKGLKYIIVQVQLNVQPIMMLDRGLTSTVSGNNVSDVEPDLPYYTAWCCRFGLSAEAPFLDTNLPTRHKGCCCKPHLFHYLEFSQWTKTRLLDR
jgi:hypothetical protein